MSFLWNSISRMTNLCKVMWVVSQDVHYEKVWFRLRLDDHSVSCLQLWRRISRDCMCMCVKCWVLGEFVLAFLESSKKGDYGSWQLKEPPVQFDRGLGFSSGGSLWAYWSQIYERFSILVFDVMQRRKNSTSRILSKVVIFSSLQVQMFGKVSCFLVWIWWDWRGGFRIIKPEVRRRRILASVPRTCQELISDRSKWKRHL